MANREIPSPPKGTRVNGRKLWGDVLGKYELEQHELAFVLTGGNAGQRPAPGWALAASISGAMEALTRELALELAPIRVNLVATGVTRSPLWGSMTEDEQSTMYASLASQLPVGRVGEPDDIALAYVYAMQQPMATGTSITVDGGAVLV